jgi:hypothetical protein
MMREATPGDRDQRAIGDAADQVAEKYPAPVVDHGSAAGFASDPRQRNQRETAGHEFEAEQHDDDQSDRKDDGADQRLPGGEGAVEREARGDAEYGA